MALTFLTFAQHKKFMILQKKKRLQKSLAQK